MKTIKLLSTSAMLVAMAVGCERATLVHQGVLDTTPIATDEAMAHRNWDQSSAIYARSSVTHYPTLWYANSQSYKTEYSTSLTETPLFIGNVFLIPWATWETRSTGGPFKMVESRTDVIEPTYTGVPGLPPENNPAPAPEQSKTNEPPQTNEPAPAPSNENK